MKSALICLISALSLPGIAPAQQDTTIVLPGDVTIDLIWIEPGTFLMGGKEEDFPVSVSTSYGNATRWLPTEYEIPQHQVVLTRGYYIGKTEITRQQWHAVSAITPWQTSPCNQTNDCPDCPADCVSWIRASAFTDVLTSHTTGLTFRLPSEAEWEYAARAGTTTHWFWGNDPRLAPLYAIFWESSSVAYTPLSPVATLTPNPWGLHGVTGNVSEWTADAPYEYTTAPLVDPSNLSELSALWTDASVGRRILRGGAHRELRNAGRSSARYFGSLYMDGASEHSAFPGVGFRVAADLSPASQVSAQSWGLIKKGAEDDD